MTTRSLAPDLHDLVARRLDASTARAEELAERDPSGVDMQTQLDLEAALDDVERYSRAADAVGVVRVKSEPLTYTRHGSHSFCRDLVTSLRGDRDATARMNRHHREMEIEARAGSTADAAGGTFAPPLWVVEQFLPMARAERVAADLAVGMPLPTGTDSVSVPTVTTGTLTAVQATENTATTTRDMATGSTTAEVTTVAGHYDCSLQLAELQAWPAGFDALVFTDMIRDYNRNVTGLVLNGTGTSNQPLGVVTGAFTSVTMSTAAATALYAGLGDAANRVHLARQAPPEVIVMHSRRWWWLTTRTDTAGAPVVQQDPEAALKMLERRGIQHSGAGIVGYIANTPIAVDDTVSTTTSSFFDDVIVWRPTDALLYESPPFIIVDRESLSSALGLRYSFHRYAAFTSRTTQAAAYLTGAGLTGPSW